MDVSHLTAISESTLPDIDKKRALALATHYPDQWMRFDAEVVGAEIPVAVELTGTDWTFVGKIDLLCRDPRGLIMIEHKTRSTSDVSKPYDPYYQKLSFDAQISAYHLAQFALGDPIERTIYDVIKKITTKPKAIPMGSEGALGTRSEIMEHGTYYKGVVQLKNWQEPPAKETPGLYGNRISYEVMTDPRKFFHQYSLIHRNRRQLADCAKQLTQICENIDRATLDAAWYQNTSNCFSYGSKCEYFDLCLGISDPDDEEKWRERKGSSISGSRSISHSKATCFQSCRRKYYWRYVKKIEPVKPDSAALHFGSVFHEALEKFWANRGKGGDDGASKE